MSFNGILVSAMRKRLFGRIPVFLLAFALIGCTSLVFGVKAWHDAKTANTTALNSGGDRPQKRGIEIVHMTPQGFRPSEINRPAGAFTLILESPTRFAEFDFTLDTERGQNVHRETMPKGKSHLKKNLNLPPGHYVLREPSYPNLVCHINIEPK